MFTEAMLESIKKVEATRAARMGMEPRRMTAEEKSELLKAYHPDYREAGFAEIKIGPNKGQKAPVELTQLLHSNSRLLNEKIDLNNPAYDVDVLVIGGGGAGSSAAIEADNAGAKVMMVTKLRIGDANTMMAEGGIQAADKPNDSPAVHYLDAFGAADLLSAAISTHPDIAAEWNYAKNGDLKPCDVVAGANRGVWWICAKEHEWRASVNSRRSGRGCPECAKEIRPITRQTTYLQKNPTALLWDFSLINWL